jgi:peptidoglycan/xylan/chitin deacetylase (PgdA/CDA1 family)
VTRSVPILTYHSLDESGSVISVQPAIFERHMRLLHERGFRGIALGDLLDGWNGKRPLPDKPIVLTFDDGFENLARHAAALLQGIGFRATIFAVAGHCGGRNDWPTQPPDVPRLPLLGWSELRDLEGAGFEVGLHGMTHAPLEGLTADLERREIVEAKQLMEDRLARPVEVFAYPYGAAGHSARELVRRHFRGACSTQMRTANRDDAHDWLGRIDVYYLRHPRLFRLLGTWQGEAYLALRALGRRARELILKATP